MNRQTTFFLGGGLLALLLVGGFGYVLLSGYQRNAKVSEQLNAAVREFERLNHRTPSITEENIEAARTEQRRVAAAVAELRRYFGAMGGLTNLDTAEFKFLLTATIDRLDRLADRQEVRIPANFGYTFANQRRAVALNPDDLAPWSLQLLEIQGLCEVLFNARVHSVAALRRSTVSTNDSADSIIRHVHPSTNEIARSVATPYEVVFLGFTTELEDVLEGLLRSPQCFIVKNIDVKPAPQHVPGPALETHYLPGHLPPRVMAVPPRDPVADRYSPSRSMPDAMQSYADRYRRSPGALPHHAPPVYLDPWNAPTRRNDPKTIIDSQLLVFTMRLDAIRPLQPAH
jgi:hypothetical protein